MNTDAELATIVADMISDQLREMLHDSEELPHNGFDTTLARRDGDDLVVELVELNKGAYKRDDGRKVLRIVVQVGA